MNASCDGVLAAGVGATKAGAVRSGVVNETTTGSATSSPESSRATKSATYGTRGCSDDHETSVGTLAGTVSPPPLPADFATALAPGTMPEGRVPAKTSEADVPRVPAASAAAIAAAAPAASPAAALSPASSSGEAAGRSARFITTQCTVACSFTRTDSRTAVSEKAESIRASIITGGVVSRVVSCTRLGVVIRFPARSSATNQIAQVVTEARSLRWTVVSSFAAAVTESPAMEAAPPLPRPFLTSAGVGGSSSGYSATQ